MAGEHIHQKCPARGAECMKCGKRNHFARVCRSGKPNTTRAEVKELDYESSSEDDIFLYTINGPDHKDWISINSHDVKFKIDTGAQCNVMSTATYKFVLKQILTKSKAKLTAFGLKSCGKNRRNE